GGADRPAPGGAVLGRPVLSRRPGRRPAAGQVLDGVLLVALRGRGAGGAVQRPAGPAAVLLDRRVPPGPGAGLPAPAGADFFSPLPPGGRGSSSPLSPEAGERGAGQKLPRRP